MPSPTGKDSPQTTSRDPSPYPHRLLRKPVSKSLATKSHPVSTTGVGDCAATNDDVSWEEAKPVSSDSSEHLIHGKSKRFAQREKYVKWGFPWKTPSLIILWALVGFSSAFGHHFYYQSLGGTKAGSSSRQSWAVRFGTAFAFLIVASLRAACDTAYKQYIWTLFKRKSFSLDTLDKLFSLTSDPTAFASWELITHAKIAFFVALLCW